MTNFTVTYFWFAEKLTKEMNKILFDIHTPVSLLDCKRTLWLDVAKVELSLEYLFNFIFFTFNIWSDLTPQQKVRLAKNEKEVTLDIVMELAKEDLKLIIWTASRKLLWIFEDFERVVPANLIYTHTTLKVCKVLVLMRFKGLWVGRTFYAVE